MEFAFWTTSFDISHQFLSIYSRTCPEKWFFIRFLISCESQSFYAMDIIERFCSFKSSLNLISAIVIFLNTFSNPLLYILLLTTQIMLKNKKKTQNQNKIQILGIKKNHWSSSGVITSHGQIATQRS